MQDAAIQESCGPVQDRSKENLVSTDNAVIMARARLRIAVALVHIRGHSEITVGSFAFGTIICGGAWAAGLVVRSRTEHAGALERETERLETERAVAVAEERARIARELHDVIAHSVSVMVVQAEAA